MRTYTITMELPESLDPSTVLEQAQELAGDLAALELENTDADEVSDDSVEDQLEQIKASVSVEVK